MRYLCILFFSIFSNSLGAQTVQAKNDSIQVNENTDVIVGGINISGNRKTKEYIILRETTFKKGDRFPASELNKRLIESRHLIYNTALFVDDSVYVASQKGNVVFINIRVKERLYFLPLPYFRLVDRNFNEWWVQQHRSLDRVNYGIKLNYNNVTGQNDKLNIWLITGYNNQVTLRYNLPFLDKKLTKGINVGFTYSRQHEINYATSPDNKQLFFRINNEYLRTYSRFDATYSYRPDQHQSHYFRVAYTNDLIADTVAKLNPAFYPGHLTNVKYLDFTYVYRYLNTDYNVYPAKGWQAEGSIYKRGIDKVSDLWQIGIHGVFAKPILPKTFILIDASATVKFPYNPYFFSQGLFGYGNYQVRGLEYYVIDGMAGALGRFSVHRELFKYIFHNPIRSKTHDKIPFRFYAKAYSDLGYAYNPYVKGNLLNNTLLHSWGIGLDIVSIYDFVFRFEFSFNQLGYNGLYLHARNDF